MLKDIMQYIPQALGSYQNSLNQEHLKDLYSANPQFAMGLQNMQINSSNQAMLQAQQQRELAKKNALREFSKNFGGVTGINPNEQGELQNALAQYAQITGDPTQLLNYKIQQERASSPASMGATGALAKQLIDEPNNGIDTFAQALQAIKGGAGARGRLGAEIDMSRQANFQGRTGTLQADLALQPSITEATARAQLEGSGDISEREQLERQKVGDERQSRFSLESMTQSVDNINEVIDTALSQADAFTTGFGSVMNFIPGTPAHNLASNLETIRSDAALGALKDLKAQGGTLGAVSEKELALLEGSIRSLANSQDVEQFKENLTAYKQQRAQSLDRVKRAYEEQFGQSFSMPQAGNAAPVDIKESARQEAIRRGLIQQ